VDQTLSGDSVRGRVRGSLLGKFTGERAEKGMGLETLGGPLESKNQRGALNKVEQQKFVSSEKGREEAERGELGGSRGTLLELLKAPAIQASGARFREGWY